MLISHKYEFVFLKGRKVAGTSAEILLSPYLRHKDDVITPISPFDEAKRTPFMTDGQKRRIKESSQDYYNHMTSAEILHASKTPKKINDYFWFTIERHPYEKVISLASFLNITVDDAIDSQLYLNYPIYQHRVDKLYDYAQLSTFEREMKEKFDIDIDFNTVFAKSGFRKDTRPASEILSDEQKKAIYADAEVEFKLMGYEG